ncbi:hypothetical protein [Streptomyces sp. SudanB91_2054]|uniref:hypothetical protein n=1 Tax=Streptomyces sp. SudanB91_2054 TaxID=3035278 RepID=UPI0036D9E0DF
MTNFDITAPEPHFSGEVAGVVFSKGRATVDSSNTSALAYFRRKGYGVNGEATTEAREVFEPTDPRDVATVEGGSLRDGAVEPRATDAGLPTNAGVANPHGPNVVSPEAPTPPGQVLDTERAAVGETYEPGDGAPKRGASKAEWQAYARSQAKDSDEEAQIGGLTKEELVERYGSKQ